MKRYWGGGKKGEKQEGRRKEPQVVPFYLLYPGKMKALQLFLRGLEKLVVINRNLMSELGRSHLFPAES